MNLIALGDGSCRLLGRLAAANSDTVTIERATSLGAVLAALRERPLSWIVLVDNDDSFQSIEARLATEFGQVTLVGVENVAGAGDAVRGRQHLSLDMTIESVMEHLRQLEHGPGLPACGDPSMRQTLHMARQFAASDASVLITGESGTGKEVVARFIHARSKRAGGPFVSLNCAAIPETLLESELFGHEKGAFTGAMTRRVGKFEEAHTGTLLLDEITEMDPRLQAKLLRAIQEREIDRVGGGRPLKVDIRLIATSNRNLEQAVSDGLFREDLYFRLNVVSLEIPPLRERPLDIGPLAHHFAAKFAKAAGISTPPITQAALRRLSAHAWRGNVRELENCIHRAVLLGQGSPLDGENIVFQRHLRRDDVTVPDAHLGFVGMTIADMERELITQTLDHTSGNRTRAAEFLGISIRTLRNKLRQYQDTRRPQPPVAMMGRELYH
ncbi:sigma-54 interaction domain-containing protein [Arboricoccus pini]|nr:sigma-54 dependent transcriptional regulator [Arboricoccus pini]